MLLKELSELNGVSSGETAVRHFIRNRIQGRVDRIQTDRLGNLIARCDQGKKGPLVMLSAHMDESWINGGGDRCQRVTEDQNHRRH